MQILRVHFNKNPQYPQVNMAKANKSKEKSLNYEQQTRVKKKILMCGVYVYTSVFLTVPNKHSMCLRFSTLTLIDNSHPQ